MAKLFQIYEEDLAKLEVALPRLMQIAGVYLNTPEAQVLFSEAKEILSNIRWDYGPPSEIEVIEAK